MRAAAQPQTSEKTEAMLSAVTVARDSATTTAAVPSARRAIATVTRTLRCLRREGLMRTMWRSLGLLVVAADSTRTLEEQRSDHGERRPESRDEAHRDALVPELGGRPDPAQRIAEVAAA